MCSNQHRVFGITKKGIPIEEAPLHKTSNVGILIPRTGNIIPEYEEREAAVYVQSNWASWLKLNWYDRAASVAQYRVHHMIETHANDEMSHQNRPKPKSGRR